MRNHGDIHNLSENHKIKIEIEESILKQLTDQKYNPIQIDAESLEKIYDQVEVTPALQVGISYYHR